MNGEVRQCVEARTGFFGQYFEVPDALRGEVDGFIRATEALGEACGDAAQFESRFAGEGLSDRFNALVGQCVPKAHQMTAEEKRASRKIAADMMYADRENLAKGAVADVASSVMVDLRGESLRKNREQMLAEGTFDEYTRRSNAAEDARNLIGTLGNLFGKRKRR